MIDDCIGRALAGRWPHEDTGLISDTPEYSNCFGSYAVENRSPMRGARQLEARAAIGRLVALICLNDTEAGPLPVRVKIV